MLQMKIVSIKLLEHIVPNCGSGTGFSEPDKFHITCDDGTERDVWIDIWCWPKNGIKKMFLEGIGEHFNGIKNIDEAWEMYVSEIANKSCPWSKKEILDTYQIIGEG